MEFRNVGRSGLRVSLVGLGCNNFGGRIDFEATQARRASRAGCRASRCSIPRTPTATAANRKRFLGELLGDRRKEIVLATKFGMAMDDAGAQKAGSRRYIMSAVEASLTRLAHRLDRPVPAAPARSADADRGNAARARRSRAAGQGALHRLLEPRRAGRSPTRRGRRAITASRAFVSRAGRVQPARARGTSAQLFPALKAFGMGLLPYYPLAGGLAHRQVRARARLCRRARG